MNRRLTRAQALAFQKRWRIVQRAQKQELRLTSPDQKLRQLAVMMESVNAMGWRDALASEEAGVRMRWNRLRTAYGCRS